MEIWIRRDGEEWGPYTLEQVKEYIASGELVLEDEAWFDGCEDYVTVGDIPNFTSPPKIARKGPRKQKVTRVVEQQPASSDASNSPSKKKTIQKAFLKSMLLFLTLSSAIGIFSILTQTFGKVHGMILLTTISLAAYSLTGLCCAAILERPKLRGLAVFGIGISILGGAFAVLTNWGLVDAWEVVLRGRFLFLIIAVSIAHVSLLMRITTSQSLVIKARRCTIAAIGVVACLLLAIVAFPESISASWQLLLIFGILDVLGTIGTPILHATMQTPSES